MASKKRGVFRRAGNGVRKHAIHRLLPYVGKRKGFSNRVAKRILWACRAVAKKDGVPEVSITEENIIKGGCNPKYANYLKRYKIRSGLKAVFGADGSLMNVLEEE